ncbi:MAG: family glycosyltransferase [Chitinophagaceae bacterium]|nr:family glycosyltransferase [Chitinophagaceae bacterium]
MERLVEYYRDANFPVVVADSSVQEHQFRAMPPGWKYFYTPGISYTEKIQLVLEKVETPFVVMCADDDFIVPESIVRCTDFLGSNGDYVSAQGTCIRYFKNTVGSDKIKFSLLYDEAADVEQAEPLVRVEKMFRPYRSILYAVHIREILRLAFKDAGAVINNLFLNEYLTAVVPCIAGKIKEFSFLYQVREFAEDSDDKITDNLDSIIYQEKYREEWNGFVRLCATNASSQVNIPQDILAKKIAAVLSDFATEVIARRKPSLSFKKKTGLVIGKFPVIGQWFINLNRKMENKKDMKKVILTDYDSDSLKAIETILRKG